MVKQPKTPRRPPTGKPTGPAKPDSPQVPNAAGDAETGGMIGEGTSGEPAADVTEDDPRTTRPGGMMGEG